MPLYLGGSLETGNVWESSSDVFTDMIVAGSVFIGSDTPLGPLYFGYGHTDTGRNSLYLFLGRTFQ